jgi:predicted heme/steroid binding protein
LHWRSLARPQLNAQLSDAQQTQEAEIVIFRYDRVESVRTHRDPFDDLCCWISGLRSVRYSRELLNAVHKFPSRTTLEPAAAVSAHADAAIQLLEQGQSAAAEVAFLPLYYALLNLAKIYVIVGGRLSDLQEQRWHGATHSGARKASHDLMTDTVSLKGRGAIPLLYTVLTGEKVPRANLTLKMSEIYRYIWDVSYEYERLYGHVLAFERVEVDFEDDPSTKGRRMVAKLPETGRPTAPKKDLRLLSHFKPDASRPNTYVSPGVSGNVVGSQVLLLSQLRRSLLVCDSDMWGQMHTFTPVSNRLFLWPEEIPILLAFFHMSNVVRYNPEFLAKLKDSRAWGLLLVLRNHGVLKFLKLFWERVSNSCFCLQT